MFSAQINGNVLFTKPQWHEVVQVLLANGLAQFAYKTILVLNPGISIKWLTQSQLQSLFPPSA